MAFEGRMWVLPCLARLCRQVGVGGGGGGGRAHGGRLGRRCSRRPSGLSRSSSVASLPFAPSSLSSFSPCSTELPGCLNHPPGFRRGLQSQQPGIHSLPPYHFDLKIIWAKKNKGDAQPPLSMVPGLLSHGGGGRNWIPGQCGVNLASYWSSA